MVMIDDGYDGYDANDDARAHFYRRDDDGEDDVAGYHLTWAMQPMNVYGVAIFSLALQPSYGRNDFYLVWEWLNVV